VPEEPVVPEEIEIRSVQVGRPSVLATTATGEEVRSAIVKQPVTAATLSLSTINLAGDDQADRTVHGGPDKAVYAYSCEHFARWSSEIGIDVGAGTFGENVTVAGVTEQDVCIGDRWAWGDALLEVCQPRWPCFKLTLRTRVRDIGHRMKADGRTGWYLRVIETGTVPVAGPITVASRHPAGVSVLDAHRAQADRHREDPALQARVLSVPALADEWRFPLEG
jgi:MOSC domain-containing protein YiiM